MSRTETIELGSTPAEEACAQVGQPDYEEDARRECRAYRAQLLRVAAAAGREVPETLRLVTKGSAHDYGSYYEVAARFPEDDEAAIDLAYWLESNQPGEWDEEARAELARARAEVGT